MYVDDEQDIASFAGVAAFLRVNINEDNSNYDNIDYDAVMIKISLSCAALTPNIVPVC